MAVKLHIQNITSGNVSAAYEFCSDQLKTVKIGRLSSAHIRLEDSSVSRIHAAIEFRDSDAILTDMGSGIGTSVNGETVQNKTLVHGDTIVVGSTTLVVGFDVPAREGMTPGDLPIFGESEDPADESKGGVGQPVRPIFDDGETSDIKSVTRLTQRQLEIADKRRLTEEQPITDQRRALEMRLFWGQVLLRMEHYIRPKVITIGEVKGADVFLSSDGLPTRRFPLIRCIKGEYTLTFTNHMEGELEIDGQLYPLQSLRGSSLAKPDDSLKDSYRVVLPATSRCLVHWGGLSFALRFVPTFKPFSAEVLKTIDYNYLNTALLSFFFHLALIVALLVYPIEAEQLNRDLLQGEPDRFVSLILAPPQKTRVANAILERLKKNQSMEVRKKPKKDTKAVLSATKTEGNIKKAKAQKRVEVRKRFSKLFANDDGASGGILGSKGGGGTLAGSLSRVIGTMGTSSSTAGLAGLGLRREVLIGGGAGTSRTISTIGTSGRLGGGGKGNEYGQGVEIGERTERRVISLSTPTIMGALSKEVVQKVIDRNKNQIRYCYEVELQRNQNLAGRIAVRWVILGTGRVGEVVIRDSTMNNPKVERCMINRIKTWQFPAPAGGGVVEVNYPFVFKANW